MPGLTLRVLTQLLHEKRYRLTAKEKKALLSEQNYRCKECNQQLDVFEVDHVVPLMNAVGEQTFQILCPPCHTLKTWNSQTPIENCLASVFNTDVWKNYVESPPPKALVFEAHDVSGKPLLLDVRKCRAQCLKESPHDFPVFSPLDQIEVAQQKLYDLAYVDKPVKFKCGQNLLRMLPYQGGGWVTKPALEYLLSTSKIGWQHVKYGITATSHIKRDFLKKPLEQIAQAWGDHPNAKRCINAMLGIFVHKPDYCYGVKRPRRIAIL